MLKGTGHHVGPGGVINNHGLSTEQLRLLLQAVLAELPRSDAATQEGAARAEAAAELDRELASSEIRPQRALALLNRITASVGSLATAGTATAQLAATLQAM